MKRLRISVVGCGGITEHYLPVYRDLEWVDVVTCVDVDLARAKKSAAIVSASATRDFAASLDSSVDAVIINTPNHLHAEQAIAALDAGKHVLLQKPMATNVQDGVAIVESATRAIARGQTCGLYMSYFDQPLMHDFKRMIGEGFFGDITHFYGRLMHRGGLALSEEIRSGKQNWRGSIEKTGGGCFIQLGVHFIHLCNWLIDSSVVRATALMKNLHGAGIEGEDIACAVLELSSGALVTLDMAWCAAGDQFSIHGTRGSAEYMANTMLMIGAVEGRFSGRTVVYPAKKESEDKSSHFKMESRVILAPHLGDSSNPHNQQRQFLEAARDGRGAYVPIAAGLSDMRVVEAVYESARSGRTIPVQAA